MIECPGPGNAPPVSIPTIPLNPRQEDWGGKVKFWSREVWSVLKIGPGSVTFNSLIASLFLEDENGKRVSEGICKAVYASIHSFWFQRVWNKATCSQLGPISLIRYDIHKAFCETLEGDYPFLHLCEGHWKVYQLWKNSYTSWVRTQQLQSRFHSPHF